MRSCAVRGRRAGAWSPRTTALLLVMTLVVAGCSVRLDLPPAPVPTPDTQESIRQEQAQAVREIADLAQLAQPEGAEGLQVVAEHARAQLQALGGVWQPPPRPQDPTPTPSAPDSAETAEVLTALEASAEAARTGATQVGGELAVLLVSIATNHTLHADYLRQELDLAGEAAGDLEAAYPSTVGPEAVDLTRVLDAAGYVAELQAARAGNAEADQLQDRAEQLRADADLIAARGDFAGTGDDPRRATYAVDLDALGDEAAALDQALVPAWLELVGPAEAADREVIAAQVLDAAARVYTGPQSLPALPGRAQ